ncbi:MAG TPA: PQQ-binding-like beta-propeller repeat protein [Anaerolineales bacterium]|nr:PQQ-binding-like beta-propeller repeat protein [Anaerolineales bacterium]
MKTNRLLLFLALALLTLTLSACGGVPTATTWPGLAADENAAYLANGSIVYAVRLSDGEQLWSFPEKPGVKLIFYANPVLTSDGQLLIGSSGSDHSLFLVDAETGKSDWFFNGARDQWVASPLVVGNMVYAPNADGNLYILDLSIPGDDKLTGTVQLEGRLWGQPTTDDNLIFVTSLDHKVFAVDPQKKSVAWSLELDGAVAGSALVADGKLYVGSFGATLQAIDIATHKIAWTASTQSWIWGGPILAGETLYVGDLDGNFYSINTADGKPVADPAKPDGAILASPILVNGKLIFVTESGAVYSIEPGGNNPLSLEKLDAKLYTAPVTAGDLILVAPFQSETSLLVALDKDGKQVWSFFPQK